MYNLGKYNDKRISTPLFRETIAYLVSEIRPQITTTRVPISAWPYLKGVSSLTSLHYIFGGRSAHLAYRVHKSGRKTSIVFIL